MTCGEEIPEWLRNQIVGMRHAGKKYTEIERETIEMSWFDLMSDRRST
jgi:hypothetical protein